MLILFLENLLSLLKFCLSKGNFPKMTHKKLLHLASLFVKNFSWLETSLQLKIKFNLKLKKKNS